MKDKLRSTQCDWAFNLFDGIFPKFHAIIYET